MFKCTLTTAITVLLTNKGTIIYRYEIQEYVGILNRTRLILILKSCLRLKSDKICFQNQILTYDYGGKSKLKEFHFFSFINWLFSELASKSRTNRVLIEK